MSNLLPLDVFALMYTKFDLKVHKGGLTSQRTREFPGRPPVSPFVLEVLALTGFPKLAIVTSCQSCYDRQEEPAGWKSGLQR